MAKSKIDSAMENGVFEHDAATLKQFANQAIVAYGKGRQYLHFVACCLVNHAVKHDGGDQFKRFIEDMGSKSQTRHRLCAWVRHHAVYEHDGKKKYAMTANVNSKGEVIVKVDNKQAHRVDVAAMYNAPYWDVLQVAKVKTDFELSRAVLALVKRAAEAGIDEGEVESAIHDAFAKVNAA